MQAVEITFLDRFRLLGTLAKKEPHTSYYHLVENPKDWIELSWLVKKSYKYLF